jgi:hypothetical protein
LIERGLAQANPVRALPRSIRRLLRPTFDPRSTPSFERLEDVKRIYQALPEPVSAAFAIGVFAGLRTAEVLGLERPPSLMRPHTPKRHLAKTLAACGLSTLTRYQATRHTFVIR